MPVTPTLYIKTPCCYQNHGPIPFVCQDGNLEQARHLTVLFFQTGAPILGQVQAFALVCNRLIAASRISVPIIRFLLVGHLPGLHPNSKVDVSNRTLPSKAPSFNVSNDSSCLLSILVAQHF